MTLHKSSGLGQKIGFGIATFAFSGAGLFILWIALSRLAFWIDVQSWEPVPMTILESRVLKNRSDDSTTYEVTATYRYKYKGASYSGNRVGVGSGSDNVGSFHQDTHRRLQRYVSKNETFPGFVNPSEPSESILIREMRWGLWTMLFIAGLVFFGAGVAIFIGGRKVVRGIRAENDGRPWLKNPDWASGKIKCSSKWGAVILVLATIFWNAISWVAFSAYLSNEYKKGFDWALLLVGLFPLIGLILIPVSIYSVLKYLKYGESVFHMASVPAPVGGSLVGVVHTQKHLDAEEGFHLQLCCVHTYTTGSGKNRSTNSKTLWSEDKRVDSKMKRGFRTKSAIPVVFEIPEGVQETNGSSSNGIHWTLWVKAKTPGIDYSAEFKVPVFKIEDKDLKNQIAKETLDQFIEWDR